MTNKTAININHLSETLLIPLWAKGVEYGRKNALIEDKEAKRMMDAIDYDFGKFAQARFSQVGCCARTKIIDDMTRRFIAEHPDCVVIQLGAGLDARYERLGKPAVEWYDLDLPEVIAIRRELLPESGNHYLAQSLFAEAWMEMAGGKNKPMLLIAEGVFMLYPQKKIEALLAALAWHCRQVSVIFDVAPPIMAERAKLYVALEESALQSMWSATPQEISTWHPGWQVSEETCLSKHMQNRYPWPYRLLLRLLRHDQHVKQHILRIDSGFSQARTQQ